MNKQLVDKMSQLESSLVNNYNNLSAERKTLKASMNVDKDKLESLESKMREVLSALRKVQEDHKAYKNKYKTVTDIRAAIESLKEKGKKSKELEENLNYATEDFKEFEDLLCSEYEVSLANEEKQENKKEKNSKGTGIIAGALVVGALAGVVGGSLVRSCDNNTYEVDDQSEENEHTETPEMTPVLSTVLGEPGTFTDASDAEQVEARASWYMDNYFNKALDGLSNVGSMTANKETLADGIAVVSGEKTLYQDFETDDLLRYNNGLVQMFCSYLTLNENEKAGFVPSQYLYQDGSYEQRCAAEVDAIMGPLVEAINNKDNESYIKYATSFGELMRDQYLNVDFTDDHCNVRGMADFSSQIHLYSLAYAEYTNKILPYGINNNINICIPICVDHNTNETVNYPLSKLMATLEFVPTSQWDAVVARSGYSVEDLKRLGNKSTEDTMPVTFTTNAKEHYREHSLKLN